MQSKIQIFSIRCSLQSRTLNWKIEAGVYCRLFYKYLMWIQQWQQEFALRFTKYVERDGRVKLHGQKQNNIFSHRPLFAEFSVFVSLLLRLCEVENHEKFSQSWFHFVSHCRRLWSCWNCHSCDNFPTKYIYNNRHSESFNSNVMEMRLRQDYIFKIMRETRRRDSWCWDGDGGVKIEWGVVARLVGPFEWLPAASKHLSLRNEAEERKRILFWHCRSISEHIHLHSQRAILKQTSLLAFKFTIHTISCLNHCESWAGAVRVCLSDKKEAAASNQV